MKLGCVVVLVLCILEGFVAEEVELTPRTITDKGKFIPKGAKGNASQVQLALRLSLLFGILDSQT